MALVSSATAGLTLALRSLHATPGTLCMIPAWTFAASAHAARAAGLIPWFVDVDERTWELTPAAARRLLREAPTKVGAILAVAPFGRPIDIAGWETLNANEDCAVVVDAAAAFDSTRASTVVTVVSLHATKILGVGEGAFVTCSDVAVVDSVSQRANFGFRGDREALVDATNAKLSEYAAALGLAGLGRWDETRASFLRVGAEYASALSGIAGVALQPGFGREWIATTANISIPPERIEPLEDALDAEGFGYRRWWGDGLIAHRAFDDCPRTATPVTERLRGSVLGLPCWRDLPAKEIRDVAAVVRAVCAGVDPAGGE